MLKIILNGEGDRAEADADQDRATHRRVQHVQDPLRQVAAERDQDILRAGRGPS